jgi:(1->4)-alpha-D-glucan 1-alpha-D-glucosylmutase
VLSEIPRLWARLINRWARLNRRYRHEVDGSPAPSRNDEYLFYQTLLGVWPLHSPDDAEHAQLIARVQAYMEKATHEAKLHTSWLNPGTDYDAAVKQFVAAVLEREPKNRFLTQFIEVQATIARFGLYNALSQLLLKLMSPGVPDIYQGQELWDFSLVDPDNRRPVDFERRRKLLGELVCAADGGPDARAALAARLAADPADPRLKLFVTWQALQFRRKHDELLRQGLYMPLGVSGARAGHVCAFAWQAPPENAAGPRHAIVVVPRLLARLAQATENGAARNGHRGPRGLHFDAASIGELAWQDTSVILPRRTASTLTNSFTGQSLRVDSPWVGASEIFADFPVALLVG